ncbi:hypothetical protein [Saccharopolyspora flava]|uniref:Uncharacterized protein n=1 Tax=Saccharopolyspora flava TaxID=95161 RepID=A0A1I6Q281_9PSEU|nr:hypothetical protein [Saccharopolyspora flava]SFS46601.1 hypothetical protein SAMN05660874_01326 [Saccharopolyspora flava]
MRKKLRAWLLVEMHERAGWLRFIALMLGGLTAKHLFGFDSSDPLSWHEAVVFFTGVAATQLVWSALAYLVITIWARRRPNRNEPGGERTG